MRIKSFSWDKILTPDEIQTCESKFGAIANGFLELAELIRLADKCAKPAPKLNQSR
jgi:hypothetical protein